MTKFDNDFNCLDNSGASGRGVILSVNGNRIEIQGYANNKANKQYIEIGACTIVMSTVKVPQKGMQIAYTGGNANGVVQAGMITVW